MKYKTLFRLYLKGIGLFFLISGAVRIPGLAYLLWAQLFASPDSGPWSGDTFLSFYPGPLTYLSQLAVGTYLFFGGRWLVNLAIPSNHPYCHECAYDLTGAVAHRCPECGTPFRLEDLQVTQVDR